MKPCAVRRAGVNAVQYPFAALVGQDSLKLALLLNAVYPAIGGVLVRGEKGTAKSTAARGLAALLPTLSAIAGCPYHCDPTAAWSECPHCGVNPTPESRELPVPFVDLPIGATEDRVLGTLDLERALREGRRAFQPGLLAAAHRGVLYIDEVNLLPDHLVDVLLDAAALGMNTVQREGIAFSHPARFLLVGTMNPEEGDLRPQFLDRFGLMVTVSGSRDAELRAEVVRRRMAFEADPVAFAKAWHEEEGRLRERIRAARTKLPSVTLSDALLTFISRLCCEFEVDGLRADLVLHKAARALAAWHDRDVVTAEDIRTAAEFALPHRRRRQPFEQPGLDGQRLNELLSQLPPENPRASVESPPEQDNGASNANAPTGGATEQVFEPNASAAPARLQVKGNVSERTQGRRNPTSSTTQGHYVRGVRDPSPPSLALDATLRAAATRVATLPQGRGAGGEETPVVAITRDDLHRKERVGRAGTVILFVVDASGSMAARQRMQAVKGAVLGLLQDAYQARDEVGVIAFRGTHAEVILPPTTSVELAERSLRTLPTGGRTPLAHALRLAHENVERVRRTDADAALLIVLLTDGKANVSLPESDGDPWEQTLQAARALAEARVPALVLDTDAGFVRLGRAGEVAVALAAEHRPLDNLSAENIVLNVRRR
jgi:magnesium chelatase subunit D